MTLADKTTTLHLRFEPNRALISLVRRFVSDFYERVISNSDATGRIALATHELLENAVKYAATMATSISIDVDVEGRDGDVVIVTENRATPELIEGLKARFALLEKESNAEEFYRREIRESVVRETGSGLGLARIMAEAEMNLALEVNGEDVRIIARTNIRKGEGACK